MKRIPNSIRNALDYNPGTGVFTWVISPSNSVPAGSVAGSLHPSGYVYIRFNGTGYRAHRVAWFIAHGEQPNVIDHINHDKSDNRLCNLRNVDQTANVRNMKQPGGITFEGGTYPRWRAKYAGRYIYTGKNILLAWHRRIMAERADHPIALTYRPCGEP